MKRTGDFSGLFQLFLYGIAIAGLGAVSMVVFRHDFARNIEEWFCKGSLVIMILYIVISAYGDLKEAAEEKRWLRLDLRLEKGGWADKFFRERGITSYADQISFLERALKERVSAVENGKIKE